MNNLTKKIISVILAAVMSLSVFSVGAGAAEAVPVTAAVEEASSENVVSAAEAEAAEEKEEAEEDGEQENASPNYLQKIINTIKDLIAIIRAALAFLDKIKTK